MTILSVLHSYPLWLSQTQTWMYTQVAELQRLGVDAHVVCETTQNLEQFSLPNLHCLHNENLARQVWHRGLRKLRIVDPQTYAIAVGRRIGTTLLHSHFGDIGWRNREAARSLNAKHVVTFYGFDVQKLPTEQPVWRNRYRELFQEVGLILCEGSHMARCIVDLGAPVEKVKVQHIGVDVTAFEFRPREWDARKPLRVLLAASFREKKGLPYAVRALGALSEDIPVELTIIGDAGREAAHQKEKTLILKAIAESGLGARTRLLGYQSHRVMLQEAYRHHVFVQPSVTAADGDTEGGAPVSIIEMLATGMPVVSTSHCDIPEVMGVNLRHLLAPERDTNALTSILLELVNNRCNWERIANAGRRRVEQEYELRTQGRRQIEYYSSLAP